MTGYGNKMCKFTQKIGICTVQNFMGLNCSLNVYFLWDSIAVLMFILTDIVCDNLEIKKKQLTLSQTTNFRLFQSKRVCRRQFQI